jgi:hypothetical protein
MGWMGLGCLERGDVQPHTFGSHECYKDNFFLGFEAYIFISTANALFSTTISNVHFSDMHVNS